VTKDVCRHCLHSFIEKTFGVPLQKLVGRPPWLLGFLPNGTVLIFEVNEEPAAEYIIADRLCWALSPKLLDQTGISQETPIHVLRDWKPLINLCDEIVNGADDASGDTKLKCVERILKKARKLRSERSKITVLRTQREEFQRHCPEFKGSVHDPDQETILRNDVRALAQDLGAEPTRAQLGKKWKLSAEETKRRLKKIDMLWIKKGAPGRPLYKPFKK
jgi:hypothetical protein